MNTSIFSRKRQKTQGRRKLRSKGTSTKWCRINLGRQGQAWAQENPKEETKEGVMITFIDIFNDHRI